MGREISGSDIQPRKAALRLRLIETRRRIPAEDRAERGRRIWERLREIPEFRESPLVCSYLGFGEEVGTAEEVRELLRQGEVRVAVPTQRAPGLLPAFSEILSWEDLSPNALGILEPAPDRLRILPTGDLPVLVVPGVGFGEDGSRLGYGLGFYDRALALCGPRALVVGLAFDPQVVDRVPVEDHDHPVDMIVTETRVIETPVRSRSAEEVC